MSIDHRGLNDDSAASEPQGNHLQRAIDCLDDALGRRYMLVERLPGKSGAWAVEAPDGEQGILKVARDSSCECLAQTVRVVQHLRAVGYPTPRPLHYGPIPGGACCYLQEREPGHLMRSPGIYTELSYHELGLLLGLLELQAGIAPEVSHDWTGQVEAVALRHQGAWTVVAQSPLPAVQRLLATCEQRCAGLGDPGWRHGDLVIGDFGAHNVLLDDHGRVAAVIDLEGAGRGDRVIDLMGLLYMVEPNLLLAVRRAALQIATPTAVTVCGVYWIVQRLFQGIATNDVQLEAVAQQMLSYVDMLA
jgi:Ser/Thr protein kinase RdoA (MazF antagonist)